MAIIHQDQITITDITDAVGVNVTPASFSLNGNVDGLPANTQQTIYIQALCGSDFLQPSVAQSSIVCTPNSVTAAPGSYDSTNHRFSVLVNLPKNLTVGGSVSFVVNVTNGGENLTYSETVSFSISLKGDTPVITGSKSGSTTTIKSDGTTIATINDGAAGLNQTTLNLYQRATSAPSTKPSSLTYTFDTHSLSGTLGNWKQDISQLTGTNPIYMISAVASSTTNQDTIATNDWVGPILLSQNGTNGYNQATVTIYKRAATEPSPPSGTIQYTFSNGDYTLPTQSGWEKSFPENSNGYPCWVTSAVAIGTDATANFGSWTPVEKLVDDPIIVSITTSNGDVFKNNSGSTTLTANLFRAGSSISAPSGTEIKWYAINNGQATVITGSETGLTLNNDGTLTVTAQYVTSHAVFEARLQTTTS